MSPGAGATSTSGSADAFEPPRYQYSRWALLASMNGATRRGIASVSSRSAEGPPPTRVEAQPEAGRSDGARPIPPSGHQMTGGTVEESLAVQAGRLFDA